MYHQHIFKIVDFRSGNFLIFMSEGVLVSVYDFFADRIHLLGKKNEHKGP